MAGRRFQTTDLRVPSCRRPLRYRPRGDLPPPSLLRLVTNLIALEVDRAKAPERASEAAVGTFLKDLLARTITDRENIMARAGELGCELATGASALVVRARPQHPEEGDWRARVHHLGGARAAAHRAPRRLAAWSMRAGCPPSARLVSSARVQTRRRQAACRPPCCARLEAALPGFHITSPQPPREPTGDLLEAGAEPMLAANVAEARLGQLSFEQTGAYRLLLPAMSEDPAELEGFFNETVAPLAAYDEQYETELVRTLETFLDADGNVAGTAERLFTHRHTIRYRLERVKELTTLDVGSTAAASGSRSAEGDASRSASCSRCPRHEKGTRGRAGSRGA